MIFHKPDDLKHSSKALKEGGIEIRLKFHRRHIVAVCRERDTSQEWRNSRDTSTMGGIWCSHRHGLAENDMVLADESH